MGVFYLFTVIVATLVVAATLVTGGTGAGNIAARMFDTEDWLDLDWQ